MDEEDTDRLWLDIWQKTVDDFLRWLILEGNLNEDQFRKLETIFQNIINRTGNTDRMILDIISPILTDSQKTNSTYQIAQFLVTNLKKNLEDLKLISVSLKG